MWLNLWLKTSDNNVRELEGGYNKVGVLMLPIKGIELTVDAAKEILGLKDGSKKNYT